MKHVKLFEEWKQSNEVDENFITDIFKSAKEKLKILAEKIEVLWEKLVKEVGGERNLSMGKELDEDSFYSDAESCHSFSTILHSAAKKNPAVVQEYYPLFSKVKEKVDKVGHCRRVGMYHVLKLRNAKEKLDDIEKKLAK